MKTLRYDGLSLATTLPFSRNKFSVKKGEVRQIADDRDSEYLLNQKDGKGKPSFTLLDATHDDVLQLERRGIRIKDRPPVDVLPADLNGKALLLIRHGGIGDILLLTPLMRDLKKRFPTLSISLAAFQEWHSFLRFRYVNKVLSSRTALAHTDEFDFTIDLAGAVENNPNADQLHMVDCYADWLGIEAPSDRNPDVFVSESARAWADKQLVDVPREKIIAVHLAASSSARSWPFRHCKQLIKKLNEKGYTCVALEKHLKDVPDCINLTGKTTPAQAAAIIERSSCLVGPDSGFIQVASALGVPAVGLYGPFPARLRVTHESGFIALETDLPCAPCFTHRDDCRLGHDCVGKISAHLAFQSVLRLLDDPRIMEVPNLELMTRSKSPPRRPIAVAEASDRTGTGLKIGITEVAGLGDTLISFGIAKAAKRAYPQAFVELNIGQHRDLFAKDNTVDSVRQIAVDNSAARQRYGRDYDIYMDCLCTPEILFSDKAVEMLGSFLSPFYEGYWKLLESVGRPMRYHCIGLSGLHITEFAARMLGVPLGGDDLRLSWKLGDVQGKKRKPLEKLQPYVTVNNSSNEGETVKVWEPERWAEVIGFVKDQGFNVVQVGRSGESKLPLAEPMLGKFRVDELAGVLEGARLHMGPEGGLVHLARAVHTRSLVLFGPTDERVFGYLDNININAHVCPPCWWEASDWLTRCIRGQGKVCMKAITSERVIEALRGELP